SAHANGMVPSGREELRVVATRMHGARFVEIKELQVVHALHGMNDPSERGSSMRRDENNESCLHHLLMAALSFVVILGWCGAARASAAAPQTITIIVGFSPGGAYDL